MYQARLPQMRGVSICKRIDDIIWDETEQVWGEIFSLLLAIQPSAVIEMKEVVMPWVHCRIKEYESKYNKVLKIREDVIFHFSDGVIDGVDRLQSHYHRIAMRYRSAYSVCETIEYTAL